MKHTTLAVLALAGISCAHYHAGTVPEPQTPAAAVDRFLGAIKAKDIKTVGEYWGNERGPWAMTPYRDSVLKVFQVYLRHDGYRIVDGPSASSGIPNVLTYHVELQAPGCVRVQPLDVVHTRRGGWLIYDVHLEAEAKVMPHCPPPPA